MLLDEHLKLWNSVFIQLIDTRYYALDCGEELRSYRFPSSAFIYIVRGNAQVWMDGQVYAAKRFHLFHGGKGAVFSVFAQEELEYYMILYRPVLSLSIDHVLLQQSTDNNPFVHPYNFAPVSPLTMFDQVEKLYEEWKKQTEFSRLQAKAYFFHFVYELLHQWHQQDETLAHPDLTQMAIRFIHEHYREPLTLADIANVLTCSEGHLSRLFKSRLSISPMQYLNQVRMKRASRILLLTDASMQEIAESTGFPDAHSFSRSFRKTIGISPAHYRNKYSTDMRSQDMPVFMQGIALQSSSSSLYNDIENRYQERRGRELFMQRKSKTAAAALMMCFTLLLGACGGAANSNGGSTATPSTQPAETMQNIEETSASQVETRIVSTPKGDVEVPANPQRVAADQYMGYLLKLGIIPVGARTYMLNEPWIQLSGVSKEVIDGIEDLGDFPMNLEKLTYLEPDLIIGSIDENIEQYEKVGTTVFLPYWEGLTTTGPLEKFRKVSAIFGKEQEAEQWITDYKASVEAAKQKLEGIVKEGETVSIVQIGYKGLYVMAAEGGNYGSSTIYEMLELPPTQQAKDIKDGFASVALEALPDYMGDHIFLYGSNEEANKEFLESPIWKLLPAVQKGQVYLYGSFEEDGDEFVMEDPYSLELQLEKVVKVMLEQNGKQSK